MVPVLQVRSFETQFIPIHSPQHTDRLNHFCVFCAGTAPPLSQHRKAIKGIGSRSVTNQIFDVRTFIRILRQPHLPLNRPEIDPSQAFPGLPKASQSPIEIVSGRIGVYCYLSANGMERGRAKLRRVNSLTCQVFGTVSKLQAQARAGDPFV